MNLCLSELSDMVEIIYSNSGFKQIQVVQAVRKFNQHNQK